MSDLKELIERELESFIEWPTDDKSHVTATSAKLFAEHVAGLWADHVVGADKMVAAVQGEPVATVEVMPDGSQVWIALKTQWLPVGLHKLYTTPQPAERQEFKRFNGEECWLWAGDGSDRLETLTCPVVISPTDLMAIINQRSPAPDVARLVEALERSVAGFAALSGMVSLDSGARNYARLKALELNAVIAAYRKQGGEA